MSLYITWSMTASQILSMHLYLLHGRGFSPTFCLRREGRRWGAEGSEIGVKMGNTEKRCRLFESEAVCWEMKIYLRGSLIVCHRAGPVIYHFHRVGY